MSRHVEGGVAYDLILPPVIDTFLKHMSAKYNKKIEEITRLGFLLLMDAWEADKIVIHKGGKETIVVINEKAQGQPYV